MKMNIGYKNKNPLIEASRLLAQEWVFILDSESNAPHSCGQLWGALLQAPATKTLLLGGDI